MKISTYLFFMGIAGWLSLAWNFWDYYTSFIYWIFVIISTSLVVTGIIIGIKEEKDENRN